MEKMNEIEEILSKLDIQFSNKVIDMLNIYIKNINKFGIDEQRNKERIEETEKFIDLLGDLNKLKNNKNL